MARKQSRKKTDRPWVENYPEGMDWNFVPEKTPVHQKVMATAVERGDLPALDFLGAKTSYADLAHQIRAFSGALSKRFGVARGSRVALLLPNTPFFPVAYYAVLMAGGTIVNCNPLYSHHELSHILSDAGADLIITLDLKILFDKAERLVEAGHGDKVIVCRFTDALPGFKRILFNLFKFGDIARPHRSGIADRISWFDALTGLDLPPPEVQINPDKDIAVQQYTGGTTGLPKGAMLSHANISANLQQIDYWAMDLFHPPSKLVAVLPFFHIFAMTTCMNLPLSNGIEVYMLPKFDLSSFLDLFRRGQPNILMAVPTLLHAVASGKKTRASDLECLKFVISGGSPLLESIREEFGRVSDARLVEGYGLTECSPVVSCGALNVISKPLSIGQPLPGTDLRFLDPDDPKIVVPAGERGELAVKGPQVMIGYFNNEAETAAAFADGWFRTGDVGYVDEDGYVFLVDRMKDLIICSGFNVYPRNIEEALGKHPDVDECNVIGVKDEYRGEAPIAFVKLVEGSTLTENDLTKFLQDKLSKIEMPREIVFRDELPKTLVGKMDKNALREDYAKSKETDSEPA